MSYIQGKLRCSKRIRLTNSCTGITHHSGQFYVGSKNGLFVYNMDGILVQKLYSRCVYNVAVRDDGRRIYCSGKNCLVTLDETGITLSILKEPELEGTTCIIVASNGTVFAIGDQLNTVVHIDREGSRMLDTLASHHDEVYCPSVLAYNKITDRLPVGQRSDDAPILVLKLM